MMFKTKHGTLMVYEPKRNRITINLQQTMETLTNTIEKPVERKVEATDAELTMIACLVDAIFYKEQNDE